MLQIHMHIQQSNLSFLAADKMPHENLATPFFFAAFLNCNSNTNERVLKIMVKFICRLDCWPLFCVYCNFQLYTLQFISFNHYHFGFTLNAQCICSMFFSTFFFHSLILQMHDVIRLFDRDFFYRYFN